MKFKTFTLRTNLLSKLLLSLALLIGSADVWADDVAIWDGSSVNTNWTSTFSTSSGTLYTWSTANITSNAVVEILEGQTIEIYARAQGTGSNRAIVVSYLIDEDFVVANSWSNSGIPSSSSDYGLFVANNIPAGEYKIKIEGSYVKISSIVIKEAGGGVAAPTSLTYSSLTPLSVVLNWTKGDNETTWQVSYNTLSMNYSITTSDFSEKPYTLEGLEPSTTYYVSIRAKKGDDYSAWSDEINFTTPAPIPVTGVTVTPSSWTMLAGETQALTAEVSPASATYKTVTWESDNTKVATVSASGVVTAVAPGSAIITATSTDNEEESASCEITVTAPVTPTGFKATGIAKDYAYLTWTNGSSESKWNIKYGTTSGSLNKDLGEVTEKPQLIVGLDADTRYYAQIRSKLGTAYSAWSEEISFLTPKVGDPSPMTGSGGLEQFNSEDWTVQYGSSITAVKDGWGAINGSARYYLSETYRIGESGNGLYCNIQSTPYQYIVTPELKAGSTISFYYTFTDPDKNGNIRIYKAVKVDDVYYVVTGTQYGSTLSGKSDGEGMRELAAPITITEGGYVAIFLSGAAIDDFAYMALPTTSVVTDNNGFATFASSNKLDLTEANLPDGLLAYKAKVDGSTVKFTPLDQNVPENTGVLLEGAAYTEYKIAVASESTTVEDNEFLVNNGGLVAESGYTYYALKKNSNPLVFATFNPSTVVIPSNKAYLKVSSSNVKEFTCEFDNPTAVRSIKEGQAAVKGAVYDLSGRRVAQPKNGLYIIDGKKVVIK